MNRPLTPPPIGELLTEALGAQPTPERIQRLFMTSVGPTPGGKYRHWDILRHLEPPAHLTPKEWWLAIKFARIALQRPLPLRDTTGKNFRYGLPDVALQMLHDIDKRATGTISASEQVTDPQTRDTYLIRSLMEEAITSSQLEGAATTRKVAKQMLQTGRRPRNRAEQMIVNNYQAMHFIRERKGVPLSPELLLELHRTLTIDTMRDKSEVGRFRTSADAVVVEDGLGNTLHIPPDAEELPERINAMCQFINTPGKDPSFMHPVVRAILLHFWLAYDHPFVDGNGRTARALFYWLMARDEYWLIEFTSISRILRSAPSKYARAFLYTETDDNDVTYFVLHQLRVINRAIDDLYQYLNRKARDLVEMRRLLDRSGQLRGVLNHRQVALVHHALRHPGHSYTIQSHRKSHNVSYQTARTDLLGLVTQRLLEMGRMGRSFVFDVPEDLQSRVTALQKNSGRS